MSEKRNKIALFALGAVMLLLLLFLGFRGRSYTWFEHYRPDSKDPYGTFLVHELLKDYFPAGDFELLRDSIPAPDSLGNYIFIGSDFWLDSLKEDRLLRFVESGSDAFIAANYIPEEFLDSITQRECTDLTYLRDSIYYESLDHYFLDSTVTLQLLHQELRDSAYSEFTFLIENEPTDYNWSYFSSDLFCAERTNLSTLGNINAEESNFIQIKYGEGKFFLHHTPIAFTNLHLLNKSGLAYAECVLSHLEARPIYWDRMRRRWGDFEGNGWGGGAGNLFADSPLRYILSQPALKWAWYTLLGMALLYLVFKAKRRQRIIPILEKNENTSLEFIGTIGRLHFIDNNHLALSKQKMKLFLGYIRERYHLSTKELNAPFEKQLAERSEVPAEVIKKIFTIHRNIQNSRYASENILVELHQELAKFYQLCK